MALTIAHEKPLDRPRESRSLFRHAAQPPQPTPQPQPQEQAVPVPPALPAPATTLTLDNWEEVFWKEIKLALYAPLRDFPDALAAVNASLFKCRDEIYARYHLDDPLPSDC